MSLIMSCISVRPQFSKLIYNGNGGICQSLNIVTIKTLSMCAVLWFACLCDSWKIFICGGVITSSRARTRTIVYRLHDQTEEEESKSLIH